MRGETCERMQFSQGLLKLNMNLPVQFILAAS